MPTMIWVILLAGGLLGLFTHTPNGLTIVVLSTAVVTLAALAGLLEGEQVGETMSHGNQALLVLIFWGGASLLGWVAGRVVRWAVERRGD